MEVHEKYMQRCIDLAALAIGQTSPNPMVGAVVVHNGQIIGEGYHHRYGQAHAEVNAIAAVQNRNLLKESTLYVSLEPCNHYGKTPACTDLILRVGIPRVVIAVQDPFPKVNGSGIQRLRTEGVEVITGVMQKEAEYQNRRFFTFHCAKRPYIILKWAQTVDGFLDVKRGISGGEEIGSFSEPLRISNEFSRYWLHRWRSEEDAILIGTQTALLDDPALTVRAWEGKNPVRVVLDRSSRLPAHLTIFTDSSALTWIMTDQHLHAQVSKRFADAAHVRVFGIDFSQADDPEVGVVAQLLHLLYEHNIQSLIIEGGGHLLQSFLDEGAWDEIRIFNASKTLNQLQKSRTSNLAAEDEDKEGIAAPRIRGEHEIERTILGDNELWISYKNFWSSSKRSMQ